MQPISRARARIFMIMGLAAAGTLALTGCGANDVAVNVNLLSFVDPGEQTGVYAAPPGVVLPPETIEPQTISLVEGLAHSVNMERVELTFSIDFASDPQAGDGTSEVRLYFADPDSGNGSAVYQTEPVYTGVATLRGGTTTTLAATLEATQGTRLLDLFQSGEFIFGISLAVDASGSLEPVTGAWTLTRVDAVVVGTGDVF
jgi:hypothetical protein